MIALIIWLAIWFIWLGYETNWMRVRLPKGEHCPSGACCDWRLQDTQVTKDMKQELINLWFSRNGDKYSHMVRCHLEGKGQPLCGWGYAYQYRDFNPEYEIELLGPTYKTTIHSNNISALRDAFRVNRNPWVKVKI